MDDLSVKATKIVIEYCLEILEEAEAKIHGKPSLARLEAALNQQYAKQYENKAYQYQWAMHPRKRLTNPTYSSARPVP
jgi:hypothetical protein